MPVGRVAMLSLHTSPLALPGTGDGGGMNVYVRSLASALVRAGVACDVLTRAEHAEAPPLLQVEAGFRVIHLDAGPRAPVPKHDLLGLLPELVREARRWLDGTARPNVLHANYWISGAVGHALKHELDLPLVATFHTLARVKADAGIDDDPDERTRVEGEVVRCADALIAATDEERMQLVARYDAEPERVEIVAPGVDHHVFADGDRAGARRRLRLGSGPVLLFAGRIQPLKGVDLAIRCLAALEHRDEAELVIVGGPSGEDGPAEFARLHTLADELGLGERVRFEPAHAHEELVTFYRAADVVLVPSRAESFGLVALEAAACGRPVVAAAVGGLRSIVVDGETGFLAGTRDPAEYATYVDRILDDPQLAATMGTRAAAWSRRYTWELAAARLRRLYADLCPRELVQCR